MKKRILAAMVTVTMAASLLAGCGKANTENKGYTIGISQFAVHGSLWITAERDFWQDWQRKASRREKI